LNGEIEKGVINRVFDWGFKNEFQNGEFVVFNLGLYMGI